MDQITILLTLAFTLFFFALISTIFFLVRKPSDNKQRHSRALHKAQGEVRRNPSNRPAKVAIARLYYQQEDWVDAHHAYRQLYGERLSHESVLPQELGQQLQYAIAAYRSKEISHAHKLFIQLKEVGLKSFEFNKYAGLCAYHQQEYTSALVVLKRAYELKQGDIEVRKYIAFTDYQLNNIHEARVKLEQMSGIANDPDAQYILGDIYLRNGNQEQAKHIFSALAKTDSHAPSALVALAEMARQDQDTPGALAYYARVSKLTRINGTPLEAEVLYNLGILSMEAGKLPAALKHFREVNRIHPNYKDVHTHIAKLKFSLENKMLSRYLAADLSEFDSIARTLIPLVLKSSVSEVTLLSDQRGASRDYSVTVPSADKRRTDNALLRFARTQSVSGEIPLREMYDKMSEGRFARGMFVTAGLFSREAQQFALARTIVLCPRDQLQSFLKKITA